MGNPMKMGRSVDGSPRSSPKPQLAGIGMNSTTYQLGTEGKVIFFVRHSQAQHNTIPHDYEIRDPVLTADGTRQSGTQIKAQLSADVLANVQLIVSSPMKRCLQTVSNAFGRLIEWGNLSVQLWPELQETGRVPCDTGSPPADLAAMFPQMQAQINQLPDEWYIKDPDAASPAMLQERAKVVLQKLYDQEENVIIVCSHNGFLRHLLGVELWTDRSRNPSGFTNGEVRRLVLLKDGAGNLTLRDGREPYDHLTRSISVHSIDRNVISDEVGAVGYLD